jgi:uncharacterized low-complexity protein
MLLANSAFAAQPLANGYLLTAAPVSKTAEGKCGEGKCGASKAAAAKAAEGKCGEGKCGDDSFAKTDADHDGKVSKAEFLAVAPQREAEFSKIDADRDGSISKAEAAQHLSAVYEANGKKMPANKFSMTGDVGK